jgi:guanylate kinase
VDGQSYHFVTPDKFKRLIRAGEMIEWAEFAGHYYGSQRADVRSILRSRKFPLWIVDVQGADALAARYPQAYTIFIMPSSFSVLRTRMEKRKMKEADIRRRLKAARAEIAQAPKYDARIINYNGQLPNIIAKVAKPVRRIIGRR